MTYINIDSKNIQIISRQFLREGSKLLDVANRKSLLAMVAYSYERDVDLDEWLEQYAAKNNMYFPDQRKNFLHMKKELNNYIETKARISV